MAGLLCASLAYGRADLFKPKTDALLRAMGPSPAAFVEDLTRARAGRLLAGFVYRFNRPADLAVLLLGMGKVRREHGSLEAVFAAGMGPGQDVRSGLTALTAALRTVDLGAIERVLGPARGLGHLLPSPLGPGAAKRLNLYLRWMVRGPDAIDFGIWKTVSPSALVIPLDTHIGRIARRLGLTSRKDLSWKTALEVTSALRQIDPKDPIRFDFALCHYGMSGVCPPRPEGRNCARCLLLAACATGRRTIARAPR